MPLRRGLSEPEAALYISIGATKFRELMREGKMPDTECKTRHEVLQSSNRSVEK